MKTSRVTTLIAIVASLLTIVPAEACKISQQDGYCLDTYNRIAHLPEPCVKNETDKIDLDWSVDIGTVISDITALLTDGESLVGNPVKITVSGHHEWQYVISVTTYPNTSVDLTPITHQWKCVDGSPGLNGCKNDQFWCIVNESWTDCNGVANHVNGVQYDQFNVVIADLGSGECN